MLEKQLEINCPVMFAKSCPLSQYIIYSLISYTSENSFDPEQ